MSLPTQDLNNIINELSKETDNLSSDDIVLTFLHPKGADEVTYSRYPEQEVWDVVVDGIKYRIVINYFQYKREIKGWKTLKH